MINDDVRGRGGKEGGRGRGRGERKGEREKSLTVIFNSDAFSFVAIDL